MKLTILIDNNTFIDKYFYGEPALSIFITVENKKILFDTGYSDAFIKNSIKMGINLKDLDYVVFSHGHNDHTWGLMPLIELYSDSALTKKPQLIAHPLIFNSKIMNKTEEIGSKVSKDKLQKYFDLNLTKKPMWITENLVFLGEIPRKNAFEGKDCFGKICLNDKIQDDYVIDDSALVYKSKSGLIIITGCSHSGICNIIEYAKEVCNEDTIIDIIGGFHLLNPTKEHLESTVKFLKTQHIKQLHPCHCTDLLSKMALSQITRLNEVGVGLQIEYA